ncbi:hypothetical protein COX58_00620 [archaeon CG_4_10_14_0_2_um_filter_Archaea_38_6]|nr:MAG: hypothetical protein COS83_04955 [archaeon CG07_land_8_20_14_0_80_38_8]PIU88643.1 MAG: hypothetical protein COS64_03345 [archaeon CG06_land_8_20_14_3_00_37_11]PJA23018.1 MAG: hypothetical protein COX58_00620 [archaeon CG_4_10_14_0_2_um_filter_Archaea_38_6]
MKKIAGKKNEIIHEDWNRLTLIDGFQSFFNGIVAPFLTIYFNNFGGLEAVGISVAALYIIKGLVSWGSSKVLNHRDMKKVFLFGQIFEGIRVVLFIFVQNIQGIIALQLIGGITGGLIVPAYNKLYVKVASDEPDNAYRYKTAVTNFSIGSSAIIAGFLINYLGYEIAFIAWGVTEIVYGIYFYFAV